GFAQYTAGGTLTPEATTGCQGSGAVRFETPAVACDAGANCQYTALTTTLPSAFSRLDIRFDARFDGLVEPGQLGARVIFIPTENQPTDRCLQFLLVNSSGVVAQVQPKGAGL